MATYTVDKIGYNNNEYVLQDSGALQLTGGSVTGPVTFGDSVSADDVSIGTLYVTGSATFTNNIQANTINGATVGSSPKFTDTITTVSTTGSGNAITSITASNGAITATKGSTFVTSADIPDVSGKIDTAGTGLSKSGTTLNHSNSVTAGTAGTSSATSGSTLAVPYVTYDAQGHITATGTHTHTISGFLTSSSTLDATKLSGTIPSGCYTDNDTKVSTAAVSTNGTYYYPVVGSDTTAAATKYYDKAGFTYQVSSQASTLTLGNSTATSSSDGRSGKIIIKGTGTTGVTLVTDNSGTSGLGNYQVVIKEKSGTLALTSDVTDTKVSTAAVTSGTEYYPTVGTSTTSAATKYYDSTGFKYQATNGTVNSTNGNALLTLGNNMASTTANWKKGTLRLYGSNTSYTELVTAATTTARTATLPDKTGTIAFTSDIPTVPSAGTSASAVGTSASGGSATTWSKSDHVHNITSTTITSALGYTPYNSTNPNGYTSNTGTVTGVKVNGTIIDPTSGVVDIGTVATSDTKVTQTSIISDTSDSTLDHNYRLVLSGLATDTTETGTVHKVDTLRFNPYQARLILAPSDTAVQPALRMTNSDNYMDWLTGGSNWFNVNGTSTSSATAGIRLSQSSASPYIEIFDNRSTATGNNDYRLFANGIKKVNNFGSSYKVQTNGTSSSLTAATWTNKGSFTLAAGTWLINVTGIWGYSSTTGIRCVRLTTTNSTSNPAAVTDGAVATMSQHGTYENKCGFSVILAPTASTTYYIMMYSTSSNTAFASYSYFRLL